MKIRFNLLLVIFLSILFWQIGGILSAQIPVTNVIDLWRVRHNLSKSYIQTADIDLDIYAPAFVSGQYYNPGDYVTHTDGYIYYCNSFTNEMPANNTSWSQLWEADKGWKPIGTETSPFTGIYDGGGFSIKNLYINRGANPTGNDSVPSGGENNIGLFGYVTNGSSTNAEIKNLGIQNPRVVGKQATGALVGKAQSIK